MLPDTNLTKAIGQTLTGVTTIISDIQRRPDYSKRPELAGYINVLGEYRQNLMIVQAQQNPGADAKQNLIQESVQVVQPMLAELINANIIMSKMGQLNTNRTISPTLALANNKVMSDEQLTIDTLIAALYTPGYEPVPPIADATLTGLTVSGALKSPDGALYHYYSKDQTVRICAVTSPNEQGAWEEIFWQGGAVSKTRLPNLRSIPLDRLTKPGQPRRVTATLKGKSISVDVAIVPNLISLDIAGALSQGDEKWTIIPSVTETSKITAVVEPDSEAAYKFLKWSGGEEDPMGKGNNRLVTSRLISQSHNSCPVSVKLKLN